MELPAQAFKPPGELAKKKKSKKEELAINPRYPPESATKNIAYGKSVGNPCAKVLKGKGLKRTFRKNDILVATRKVKSVTATTGQTFSRSGEVIV